MIKHILNALVGALCIPVAIVFALENLGARTRRQMTNARAKKATRKRYSEALKG